LVICIGFNREDPSVWEHTIFKVSQGILDDIEEAHDAGFAVAVAYPNPGGNTLNIRTALQNAHVEVYDLNGKLFHSQEITDNITPINTSDWSNGTYIWKVSVNGKETESWKWIKSL
ncbi:MAG: T9SS type A sorting domain-containing protein, partial [Bacteroidales bacterium]|nr:T9SS type A sorting domain-containing protein [Bacteroidales bacterium]